MNGNSSNANSNSNSNSNSAHNNNPVADPSPMNNAGHPQANGNAAAEADVGATTPPSSPRIPTTPQAPRKKRRKRKISKTSLASVRQELIKKKSSRNSTQSNSGPSSGNTNPEGSTSAKWFFTQDVFSGDRGPCKIFAIIAFIVHIN